MITLSENSHLYHLHEIHYAAISPIKMMAQASKALHRHPLSPLTYTGYGRSVAAAAEVIERVTHRYGKPNFGITHTKVDGKDVAVHQEIIDTKPFCRLIHFKKDMSKQQPAMLIVAPMSGHHATLLRGTVEALLPFLDVYITDWLDARDIPGYHGEFRLEDYISYVIDYSKMLDGPHMLAVCQPSVPVLVAASVLNQQGAKHAPRSMTLIGGPIDTRINPTKVNQLAATKPMEWFQSNVITRVPFNYAGFMRRVYPGFLQLSGFMQLNLDRHINAHVDLFKHLVEGDGDSASAHKKFYDEYLSVCDLPAEFYLDCIEQVFQKHLLPKGEFMYKGKKVKPDAITQTALLTLEGELDDISGVGQTEAAQHLCSSLPASKRKHHMQKGVGHYGIFNGRKFREHVVPIIVEFVRKADK
ncbi:MAG: polyhydroxyalkanoate depolymerase [Rickettsiales bacterium]|nr:polyhydroxyalkanoate depolymerase [Rickettsiales bacterium]